MTADDAANVAHYVSGGGAAVLALVVLYALQSLRGTLTMLAESMAYLARREREREAEERTAATIAQVMRQTGTGPVKRAPTPSPIPEDDVP